ncbi:MAG: hypothetical protein J0M29_16810 [Chitinophagales bacterium]|nr:hypothetical protein [Chitinophagales bacterium]
MNGSAKIYILILMFFWVNCNINYVFGQLGDASELSLKSRSSIAKLEAEIHSISNSLMNAVYDTSYTEAERIEFVILLGEIGTEECIDFLINNLNYQIFTTGTMGETGLARTQIFIVVLSERVKNKWSVVKSIRKALQSTIIFDKKMLTKLTLVLTTVCDNNVDTVLNILKNSYNGTHSTKKNIDEILLLISGHK